MAAAEINRDICYFTFGDEDLRDTIFEMYSFLKRKNVTIGQLYDILTGYDSIHQSTRESKNRLSLYKYIKMELDCCDQDTDEDLETGGSANYTKNPLGIEARKSPQMQPNHEEVGDLETNSTVLESVDMDESTSSGNKSEDKIKSSKSEKQAKLTDYFARN